MSGHTRDADNTGYRTAELSRQLLKAHPNLYMEIKIDPVEVGKNSPLVNGGSGAIKPEWLKLFQDFPDRFVIGTDQHYSAPAKGPQRWQTVVLLFNQLPGGRAAEDRHRQSHSSLPSEIGCASRASGDNTATPIIPLNLSVFARPVLLRRRERLNWQPGRRNRLQSVIALL